MNQPSYIAHGESINNTTVAIIEPAPLNQLIKMLDKINTAKVEFKYGIRMLDPRQHIAYIIKNRFGYTVCIEVENDKVMRPLASLAAQDMSSIIQRLKVDFREQRKGK